MNEHLIDHILEVEEYLKHETNQKYSPYYKTYAIKRQLIKDQENFCACCHKKLSEFQNRIILEHNHKTGKIRGVVCVSCNRLIILVEND